MTTKTTTSRWLAIPEWQRDLSVMLHAAIPASITIQGEVGSRTWTHDEAHAACMSLARAAEGMPAEDGAALLVGALIARATAALKDPGED